VAEEFNPPGYQLDTRPYILELYRLLCMVMADERIARLGYPIDSAISRLRDEHVYNEVKRTLISSAVALRICLDESHPQEFAHLKTNCGKLYPNWSKQKKKFEDLSLREACNKVIHATEINEDLVIPNRARNPDYEGTYLRPYLYLYGVKGKQEWKAVLSVIEFVKWGSVVLRRWH
jgi:hypothetical protein